MSSGIDVLILDDDEGAGEEYARLVEGETRLNVHFTPVISEALEIVRENPVKVAVLDQRMGSTTGTKVFEQIAELDKRVRAVMFTGLASASEVGEALKGGYREYLHKNEVDKLGTVVLEQYQRYQAAVASEALEKAPPVLLTRKHGFPRRRVEYLLLKFEVLDDAHVREDAWRTVVSLQAGEDQKFTESLSSTNSLTLETESQQKLNTDLGFKPAQLQALSFALKTEISYRMKHTSSAQLAQAVTKERTYKLPAEPDDPDKLHVKARRYERAVVFRRMRVSILASCQCCGLKNVLSLTVAQETGGTATRQVDTLSDGSVRVTNTGILR